MTGFLIGKQSDTHRREGRRPHEGGGRKWNEASCTPRIAWKHKKLGRVK